ncbi:MAG: PAS domain-containing protein, partial [Chloroflexi bacterium]|nr:PAS domain-containing protein [Chloroflexota bacterium]
FPGVKDFGIFEVMQRVWRTEVPESFPAKLYKDNRISGWRENYVYKLPSGDIVAVYEDVTERKKGKEALEEAEQRYKIVADFTYDWEFWRSPEGKMLYVSPACERITGYTPTQFMKDPRLMDKIILSEDKHIRSEHLDKIKALIEDRVIYRIKRKDGDVRWIEHVCRPILDDKGTFLGTHGSNRDITARKKAEEKLEESEDKYRLLFDTANEGIAVGQDGRVKFFNPKFAEILGYSTEEIQSKYLSEYLFPEDRNNILNGYLKSLQGEKTDGILPFRIVTKSGETRWVEMRYVLINWDGRPATLNFAIDISERKLAEDTLRKSEDKYRTILEKMDEAYYETDLKGNLTFFNDTLSRLMGYTREEMQGMNFRKFVPAGDHATVRDLFIQVYRTGGSSELHRQAHIRKDGSTIYVEVSAIPIKNARGEVTGFRGVFRDTTARLKAEEELELRAELLDSANDSIYVMDLDGNFIYANEAFYKTRGYTLEEIMSLKIHDLITPENSAALDKRIAEVVRKTDLVFESAHLRKDGASIPVEIHARPIIYNGQTCLLSTARDITARKRSEKEIRNSEEKYRLVVENAYEGIVILQDGGHGQVCPQS